MPKDRGFRAVMAAAAISGAIWAVTVPASTVTLGMKPHNSPSLNSPSLNSPSLNSPSLNSPSLNSPSLNSPSLNSP